MTTPCAVYDFRSNFDNYSIESLTTWLTANTKKFIFQLEQGDTGYKHWQGRFSLIKKRCKPQVMSLFKDIPVPNYLEPTTNKEHQRTAFYCLKEDTRLEGPFTDSQQNEDTIYIPTHLRNVKLYDWQQQIIDSKKKRNPRQVNLIYDPVGNMGKSTLASIAELKYGGIDMPPINDFKEMIAMLCNICMDSNNRDPGLIFLDMPRAMRKDQLYGMYSAIEQIKKGKLYDMRYHYKCWWIESPEVWVFSNILPDVSFLSKDRWNIMTYVDNKLVPYDLWKIEPEINPLDIII